MRKSAPVAVEMPSPDRDNPGWVKVGVIAAVGFILGIAWPRVMGVRLGPSAPGEASTSSSASKAARAADAPPASVAAKTAAPVAPALPPSANVAAPAKASGPPQISVLRGSVIGCRTDDGESKKGRECGSVSGLDPLVASRLRKLATCGAAEGQTGKLSFVVTADFASGKMTWDVGKSSTVGNVDGLTACLKTHFQGVTMNGVAHEHPRYTVAYTTTFAPPLDSAGKESVDESAKSSKGDKADKAAKEEKGDDKNEPVITAGSDGSVAWEVALVRDAPKTGQVVARLPRGSKVKVGALKDGWYAVKYGDGFSSDGWLYRGAVGR